jgi:hypothetical protein
MSTIERINPLDDTARLKFHREIETEGQIVEQPETPISEMTRAELTAVILHDSDMAQRRLALFALKLDILLDAEARVMRALTEAKK